MTQHPPTPPQPPQGPQYGYGGSPPQPPYGYGAPQGLPQGAPQGAPHPQHQPLPPPQHPQQPPYGYGGPPQQVQPQPPYGYDQPPAGSYPPPGYGYPPGYGPPPPPSKGPGKWLLIGGLAVAAIIALVVVVGVRSGSGDSDPATSAGPGTSSAETSGEEAAIRRMIASLAASDTTDFASMVRNYFCTADRELLEAFGDMSQIDIPDGSSNAGGSGEITDIKVTGDTATAEARVAGLSSTMYFRKEGGQWKFCMSDSPELSSLPTFPR